MLHLYASKIPNPILHFPSKITGGGVGHQLPGDTPAEGLSNELVALCYSVISVRQMTAIRPQAEGGLQTFNIPLVLMTLTRIEKALEIFKLTNIEHISGLRPTELREF